MTFTKKLLKKLKLLLSIVHVNCTLYMYVLNSISLYLPLFCDSSMNLWTVLPCVPRWCCPWSVSLEPLPPNQRLPSMRTQRRSWTTENQRGLANMHFTCTCTCSIQCHVHVYMPYSRKLRWMILFVILVVWQIFLKVTKLRLSTIKV